MQEKQAWGSRLGVILAVAGSAVGLGNFLRFPGHAAPNGGGAFMIPYFFALLFLGIPIGWAEWTMGRYGGRKGFHSAPAIMGVWGKGAGATLPRRVRRADPARGLLLLRDHRELVPGLRVELRDGRHRRRSPATRSRRKSASRRSSSATVTGNGSDGFLVSGRDPPERLVLADHLGLQHLLRLPRPLEGHREVLLVGDAGDGGDRPDRAGARADARHARPGPARPERGRPGSASCGTPTFRSSATRRPGSPRRARSSSACRSASA